MLTLTLLLSLSNTLDPNGDSPVTAFSSGLSASYTANALDDRGWQSSYSGSGPAAGRLTESKQTHTENEANTTVVVIQDGGVCEDDDGEHHEGKVRWRDEDDEWLLRLSCGERSLRPTAQWNDGEIDEFGIELSRPVFNSSLIYTDVGFQWGEEDALLDLGLGTPSGVDFWELSFGFSLRQEVEILGLDTRTRLGIGWAYQAYSPEIGGVFDTEYISTPYLDAGLDFRLSRDLLLGFKYRITPRLDFDGFGLAGSSTIQDINTHAVTIGLTFEL